MHMRYSLFIVLYLNSFYCLAQFTVLSNGDAIITDTESSLSASWADYDQDGDLDLIVGNDGVNSFYRNDGGLTFTKNTPLDLSTDENAISYSACWIDYDNDGFLDIFFSNEATNQLFRNNQNGTLSKVTGTTISDLNENNKRNSIWLDYDNDGDLDVSFLRNTSNSLLYLNDGNHINYTSQIINTNNESDGGNWGDYDKDGDLDLFAANGDVAQNNFLFENNGGGFTTITGSNPIINTTRIARTGLWLDYDNDEDLDLFVATNSPAGDATGYNELYRNDGSGTFTAVTTGEIITRTSRSRACSFADFDNDGDLDICLVNFNQANQLFYNNGDGTFTENTASDFSSINRSAGVACGDVNNDGFIDIYVLNTQTRVNELFTNNGNSNNWIGLNLKGVKSNKFAIGTKVTLTAGGTNQFRELQPNNGYGGQNDYRLNFGIGTNTSIEKISIQWPSGVLQEINNPSINQYLEITEILPSVALDNTNSTNDLIIGASNQILFSFQASINSNFTMLEAMQFQGTGSFTTDDFDTNGIKLWYNTTDDLSTATTLGQISMPSSKILDFTALDLTLNIGQTYYFWITGDINSNAPRGNTIEISPNTNSFNNCANVTDNLTNGGQKIFALPLSTPSISGITNVTTLVQPDDLQVQVYQIKIDAPSLRQEFSLESLSFLTEGTYEPNDFVSNSFKLYAATEDNFSLATELGFMDIVATGQNFTFSNLNQNLSAGTSLFLWLTVDVADNPINGSTFKVSTPRTEDFSFTNIGSVTSNFEESNLITIINPAPEIIYPNIFTPNGDGQNDIFVLRLMDVASIDLVIWDRFGNTVYQTSDVGEATQIGWDGDNQPTGLYIWKANILLQNKTEIARKGEIKLVR